MQSILAVVVGTGTAACAVDVPDEELEGSDELRLGSVAESLACGEEPGQCFGAVGVRCGGTPPGWPDVPDPSHIGCSNGACWINAGSWRHDECCASHPSGYWCNGLESASPSNSACQSSFGRAAHRVLHGLGWKRSMNFCDVDDDGTVNFNSRCALDGTIVALDDVNFCCSRAARDFRFVQDAARAVSQGLILDGTFTARVCAPAPSAPAVPPARPPRACNVDADCNYGDVCRPDANNKPHKKCIAWF